MITYQFDQCFSDKALVQRCCTEGLARAIPLSSEFHDLKDPELLATVLPIGNPLVTTDWALPHEHQACLPDLHPGIIAIRYSIYAQPRVNRTMTTGGAARILTEFKRRFPDWHVTNVSNSILYLSEADVELSSIRSGELKYVYHAFFAEATDWQTNLKEKLAFLSGVRALPG